MKPDRKAMKKSNTWTDQVNGALRRLRHMRGSVRSWEGLWSSPAYALIRRYILHKEDARTAAATKLSAIERRIERIEDRYGTGPWIGPAPVKRNFAEELVYRLMR